jgi:hypothetical protein
MLVLNLLVRHLLMKKDDIDTGENKSIILNKNENYLDKND